LIVDLVVTNLKNSPRCRLHYLSWTIIAEMTLMTGIPAWIAGRILQWTLSIAHIFIQHFFTTHPACPSGPLATIWSLPGILGSKTIRPRQSALGMHIYLTVSLWLAVDWIAPIRAGDLDEDWTSWSRLMEDATRRRRKTAALYQALGHAARKMLARPSCFTTRPLSPSRPGPIQSVRTRRRTTP